MLFIFPKGQLYASKNRWYQKENDGIIYIIPLDQRMSTPDFVVPSSPIPHRATLDLIPLFDGNKRPWHQKETEEMMQDTIELVSPPPSKSKKKKQNSRTVFFKGSQRKGRDSSVGGGIFLSKRWS